MVGFCYLLSFTELPKRIKDIDLWMNIESFKNSIYMICPGSQWATATRPAIIAITDRNTRAQQANPA